MRFVWNQLFKPIKSILDCFWEAEKKAKYIEWSRKEKKLVMADIWKSMCLSMKQSDSEVKAKIAITTMTERDKMQIKKTSIFHRTQFSNTEIAIRNVYFFFWNGEPKSIYGISPIFDFRLTADIWLNSIWMLCQPLKYWLQFLVWCVVLHCILQGNNSRSISEKS